MLSARACAKPAIPIGQIVASAPPASMMSASSSRIIRAASPIECAPVEQAVTTAWLGPIRPYLMLTWPEIRLMRRAWTKCGETRPGPFAASNRLSLSIPGRPPMPDPIEQPARSFCSSVISSRPASSIAWPAASMPKMMKGSTWRCTLWSTRLPGSKPYSWSGPLTSHAMVHFWSDASKWVIWPAPDLPASRLAHVVSTSAPSGVTKPNPVTTTRRIVIPFVGPRSPGTRQHHRRPFRESGRIKKASRSLRASARDREAGNAWAASPPRPARPDRRALALVRFDIVDRILDGGDLFRRGVGGFDTEFFFERHHQFDDVEAVCAQIVDEARFLGDLVGFDAQMFDDDLLNLFGRIAHALFLF